MSGEWWCVGPWGSVAARHARRMTRCSSFFLTVFNVAQARDCCGLTAFAMQWSAHQPCERGRVKPKEGLMPSLLPLASDAFVVSPTALFFFLLGRIHYSMGDGTARGSRSSRSTLSATTVGRRSWSTRHRHATGSQPDAHMALAVPAARKSTIHAWKGASAAMRQGDAPRSTRAPPASHTACPRPPAAAARGTGPARASARGRRPSRAPTPREQL